MVAPALIFCYNDPNMILEAISHGRYRFLVRQEEENRGYDQG
jgi:hypothetical protein